MKRFVTAILIGVFGLLPCMAQDGRGPGGAIFGIRPLVSALRLDQAQVEKLQGWLQDRQEALQPLTEEFRRTRQALAAAVEANDAPTVGALFLEGQEITRRMQDVRSMARESFPDDVMLTPDQRGMLDFLAAALEFQAAAQAARALGVTERVRRGDRDGDGMLGPPRLPPQPTNPPDLTRNNAGAAGETLDQIAEDVDATKRIVTAIAKRSSIVVE